VGKPASLETKAIDLAAAVERFAEKVDALTATVALRRCRASAAARRRVPDLVAPRRKKAG
jgi:hypothetical protein